MDSQAKYAMVASGEADVYLRLPTKTEVTLRKNLGPRGGGVLIVQEAGGTVTDLYGKPLDFSYGRELETKSRRDCDKWLTARSSPRGRPGSRRGIEEADGS